MNSQWNLWNANLTVIFDNEEPIMKKPKILFWQGTERSRSDFISNDDFQRLENNADVRLILTDGKSYSPEEVIDETRDADIVIGTWATPKYSDEVLAKCGQLKMYARIGGAVRGIVGESAWQRGIKVVTAVDAQGKMLAELTLTHMLTGLHKIPMHVHHQKETDSLRHGVGENNTPQHTLVEKTVGLVGFGSIAQHVTRMLQPFNCNIFAYDPYMPVESFLQNGVTRLKSINELCEASEILSIHTAKLPQTLGIIGKEAFNSLRPGALLINTSWAELVDIAALQKRLEEGTLYACFDCIDLHLLKSIKSNRNCFISTGIAVDTDGVQLMGRQIVDEIIRFINEQPLEHEVMQETLTTRG